MLNSHPYQALASLLFDFNIFGYTPTFIDLFAWNRNLKTVAAANWLLSLDWENSFENWTSSSRVLFTLFLCFYCAPCHTNLPALLISGNCLLPVSSVFLPPLKQPGFLGYPCSPHSRPLSRWRAQWSLFHFPCGLHTMCIIAFCSLLSCLLSPALGYFTPSPGFARYLSCYLNSPHSLPCSSQANCPPKQALNYSPIWAAFSASPFHASTHTSCSVSFCYSQPPTTKMLSFFNPVLPLMVALSSPSLTIFPGLSPPWHHCLSITIWCQLLPQFPWGSLCFSIQWVCLGLYFIDLLRPLVPFCISLGTPLL